MAGACSVVVGGGLYWLRSFVAALLRMTAGWWRQGAFADYRNLDYFWTRMAWRGTVRLGGEAGNVAYDPVSGRMLVDVQSRNQLAVINPATRAVIRRVPLLGCEDDHGLALDSVARLAFIACTHPS